MKYTVLLKAGLGAACIPPFANGGEGWVTREFGDGRGRKGKGKDEVRGFFAALK